MENQIPPPTTTVENVSTEIFKSVNSLIGYNRYQFLKTLSNEDLTDSEVQQMKNYEEKHIRTPEQIKRELDHFEKISKDTLVPEKKFTKKELWNTFQKKFKEIHGKDFIYNDEVLENIKPLMYYFLQDEMFFSCKNLSNLSEPSFDKGVLIIGDYGNGKTATMEVFESIFRPIKSQSFRGYSTNELVKLFEKIKPNSNESEITRAEFDRMTITGTRYFDDAKTERNASNFGIVNIMKEVLEIREKRNLKTHLTCNFKEGYAGDVKEGLKEFQDKYGNRMYDRIFKMFNIIIFTGKSFRR